jgi:hypothetical protein
VTHPILKRILLLDHVADERLRDHARRSTSYAAVVGTLAVFVLLEFQLLVQHVISWDLLIVIYAMGATKLAFMLWYRFRN